MTHDIGSGELKGLLRFPFQQEGWEGRIAVGVGLFFASFLIPFLPAVFVYGYLIEVMRGAVEKGVLELPEWEDWGQLFIRGLKALVVGFVYLLPGTVVITVGFCLYCGTFAILPFVAEGGGAGSSVESAYSLWVFLVMLIFFFSLAIGTLVSLLGAIPIPVAAASLSAELRLGAAFRLRHFARALAANPAGFFGAWVVFFGLMSLTYLMTAVAYYTLVLACLIPILLTPISFYALLVAAAQFGLAYREGQAALENVS